MEELMEDKQSVLDFVMRILRLELQIKEIKEDIKSVKQEAKEQGLLVGEITKAISEIKREVKKQKKPNETTMVEEIKDLLAEDSEITSTINELVLGD